ncbi:hypothetical protein [Actinokineospora sp. NBRC 105648]|uniref:hypothetical protein n=1 Tax=Actinokineospora sp. NBRC 105648 TaxID=3032206 RepID=UPI0024A111CD|nr:hypothetical protein [Actinokineospora sp. NBRC 105648]GLZ41608.1 hypothetical protein Acsp05_52320 [Actinokineospora sp. NBRC 105648]
MEAALSSAITAVHHDDAAAAERWFELVRATHDQLAAAGRPEWSEFSTALAENAGSAGVDGQTVEQFVEHMAANDVDPAGTVEQMARLGTDLPAYHAELTAAAVEPAAADDSAAWAAFLPEHGPRWDGQDASWEQFAAWFRYEADQHGAGTSAAGFIAYAEGQPDKVAVFAQYGVPIAAQPAQDAAAAVDVSSFPEVRPGDSGEWVDYLDTLLTSHGF